MDELFSPESAARRHKTGPKRVGDHLGGFHSIRRHIDGADVDEAVSRTARVVKELHSARKG